MLEYNCGDVELVKFIDEKVGIIKYFWELSKFIGCRIEDTLSASRMIDVLMLKYKKEYDNKVLPSKSSTKPQTFQGAFVKDPEICLYNNVIVLDLNKLYPSIITTFHFSPNTILLHDYEGDCITLPNGLKFSKKEKGFTPQILEKLFHIRSFYEEEKEKFEEDTREWEIANNNRQFAKDLCNSFYGILSYSGCRCYVPEVGASITLMGREIIKATIEFVEKLGYKVIYSDTDSIFLLGKSVGEESLFREGFLVEEKLNSFYPEFVKKYGVDDSSISISLEKIYEKFLILAKKRYSGFLYKKGRLESKGIETRRSDSSKFTKNILNDLLVGVLVTGWDRGNIESFINKVCNEIYFKNALELGIPRNLGMNINEYKVATLQTRACLYSNKYLNTFFGKGSKPLVLYVKKVRKGLPFTDVVAFEELEQIKGFEPDFDLLMEKLIFKKIDGVLNTLGIFNFFDRFVKRGQTIISMF